MVVLVLSGYLLRMFHAETLGPAAELRAEFEL